MGFGGQEKQRSILSALGMDIGRLELESGRLNAAENTLSEALLEAVQYRPSPKAAARADFDVLKLEARRQLARVAESLLPQTAN